MDIIGILVNLAIAVVGTCAKVKVAKIKANAQIAVARIDRSYRRRSQERD